MDQLARNEELLAQLQRPSGIWSSSTRPTAWAPTTSAASWRRPSASSSASCSGGITRHLLLMTATPHSGKEEDFQLFLTLLDRDRFEGKYQPRSTAPTPSGVMRRMVKEDLLTFEGKPLFPERIAETVPYELTELEQDLYEQVTTYVREGMNRADQARRQAPQHRRVRAHGPAAPAGLQPRGDLSARWSGAATAGAPQAGGPRRHRAPSQGAESSTSTSSTTDEYSAGELEEIEEELVDAATAARTVEELDAELLDLADSSPPPRKRPGVGHRPQVVRAAHDPRGQHPRDIRRG